MNHEIVSRAEWLAARKTLLAGERSLTRQQDQVRATRRALPWTKVGVDYAFASATGPKTLAELFQGRSQLFVQHLMLSPDADHFCPSCGCMADHAEIARHHLANADLAFAAISRASVEEIEAIKRRMGWTFEWVSSADTSFSYDYGASFTAEQIESGEALYNFETTSHLAEDLPASLVFARDEAGAVFHTYSAYARGTENLFYPFHFLDFAPKGRHEADGVMNWVRLRDEY
ncbi:MAG: DUF899 family protein [Pseudomonadota bacterium]